MCDRIFIELRFCLQHQSGFCPQLCVYRCNRCSFVTAKKIDMSQHAKRYKLTKCSKCLKSFSRLEINNHRKNCMQTRFPCRQCDFRASIERQLGQHIAEEHEANVELYPNCLKCNRVFLSDNSFNYHVNISGCKGYRFTTCNYCLVGYKSKTHMRNHITRKHAKKFMPEEFECKYCKLSFKTMKAARIHKKTRAHLDHELFACHGCQMPFDNEAKFVEHVVDSCNAVKAKNKKIKS